MINLIRAMFATPEAQADAYVWAAALMGHWAIGAGLTALALAIWGRGARRSAAMISIAYLLGWEGGQQITAVLHGSASAALVWDSILDWTAVTLGAVSAAAIWQHSRRTLVTAVGTVIAILTAGVGRRK